MAYIIPSDISKLAFNSVPSGEMETLRLLQQTLPNDYTVFHGVHWTREYQSWTHFGEIDFVILARTGKVLFIEQKNGTLEEQNGRLIKRYGSNSKDVVDQLHRSIDKVREKYRLVYGQNEKLDPDYLVYCPDYHIRAINGVGIDTSRIVDAGSRSRLAEIIQNLIPVGNENEGLFNRLKSFFTQSFDLVPDIHAHTTNLDNAFIRQTGTLVNVLANLEMDPFRLRISGTAGSGKSQMVHGFMEKQASRGKRILFLCFNHLLAENRKRLWHTQYPDDTSKINTFHGFCWEFLASKNIYPDFENQADKQEFWPDLLDQVTALEISEDWKFDTLIVDEGQDFEQEWYEIVYLFLNENADILWLEDNGQSLRSTPTPTHPVKLDHFVNYNSIVNYRTPESIATYIKQTLPFTFEVGNSLPGMGVETHIYKRTHEQPRMAARVVQELIQKGFKHDDIAIISCKGLRKTEFKEIENVGNLPLKRFTGEYDNQGRQIMTEGKIRFDSIYRFKGLEAPAVILVDIDFNNADEEQERILYCAMTRATVRLDILASNESMFSQYG